jgi:hypothetical protein
MVRAALRRLLKDFPELWILVCFGSMWLLLVLVWQLAGIWGN